MSKRKTDLINVASVVESILNDYSKEIKDGIVEIVQDVAKLGKDELRKGSPRRTGDYYRGWRVNTKRGNTYIHCTLYNATNYQLTHLLEKGHKVIRNGKIVGHAKPIVHIKTVESHVNEEFVKRTEQLIRGGK